MGNFAARQIAALKEKIGDKKVLCALSGGVDSAVAATLIHKACPGLICVFVDHGLLRKNEAEEVKRVFGEEMGMNLITLDVSEQFLNRLSGVTEPEKKRKIIGEEFIRAFRGTGKEDRQSRLFGAGNNLSRRYRKRIGKFGYDKVASQRRRVTERGRF